MEVKSVNLTHRKELRFPDLPDGDFEKNSRHNLSSVMLPREAFPSNTSGKYINDNLKSGTIVGMISFSS